MKYKTPVQSVDENGKVRNYESQAIVKKRFGYRIEHYLLNPDRKDKYGRTWRYRKDHLDD